MIAASGEDTAASAIDPASKWPLVTLGREVVATCLEQAVIASSVIEQRAIHDVIVGCYHGHDRIAHLNSR